MTVVARASRCSRREPDCLGDKDTRGRGCMVAHSQATLRSMRPLDGKSATRKLTQYQALR